ncbi:heat shock Hsp30-like protein [Penicillium verhagenii]|uniref:heat shock Hsp30-like protein n=1 Tax=Penicillium verhagenii TaxID=1562060 RepID=UPI002545487C|nr:heat shock Hsp30-like protein [Penicillium verhagenii]KAJ5927818.1 heat shock Hsp30-like protein [Penicillium verhagenii]
MSFLASDFSPLFRLIDNYDKRGLHQTCSTPRAPRRTFAPAFDVRELDDGYYLDGELPGVSQDNIEIEFSDPTTLVIKGRTERDYKTSEPKLTLEPSAETLRESSPRQRQPTVEDEDESDSNDSDSTPSVTSASVKSTPVPTQPQTFKPHYWASERSIGDFQRTFSFSNRVDQDGVRASLRNGVLSIVVPKEIAPKPKKIRIE